MLNMLAQLQKYKASPIAVLLGCGDSIKDVSLRQWERIERCDLWATNNWVYHPSVVPNFYVVETKHYAFHNLAERLDEKVSWFLQRETQFIFPKGKHIRLKNPDESVPLKSVLPSELPHYEVPLITRGSRDDKRYTADYVFSNRGLHKSYDMSMTFVLELIYRMGYEIVITLGVDLRNSLYFWSNGDYKYGTVHHLWNKQHEDRNPFAPHNTSRIVEFFLDFDLRHFRPNHKGLWTANKDSLLYPGLKYHEI